MTEDLVLREGDRLALFRDTGEGVFLDRPNRFVVDCLVNGRRTRAHLPNPGRLWEFLFPGTTLSLARNPSSSDAHTPYTVVAVERDGLPVMLHTHHTNTVAGWLIERGMIPGLEGYRVVRPEVSFGRSRFDFLLRRGEKELVLEVKSCTLFGGEIAMFPDAITERGRRHLVELAALAKGSVSGGILFVVHWPFSRYFMPDYHTDLAFSQTLCRVRRDLLIKAVSVGWNRDLTLGREVRELEIPWDFVGREAEDRGSYIAVLRLQRKRMLTVGSLGPCRFPKGYYLYAGSAMKGLTQRMESHRRRRKRLFWHIDHLREAADFVTALPVRSSERLECEMGRALREVADWSVPGFGSSDCSCETHLFGMRENPLRSPGFIRTLLRFRIDRLGNVPGSSGFPTDR